MKKTFLLLSGLMLTLVAHAANISFADGHVKALCVEFWDENDDGEFSEEEAAAVTSLSNVFAFDKDIFSFDELKYFTGLERIATNDFYGCSALRSIMLPSQVESIGSDAFYGCTSLTAIDIPESVTSIGNFAFNGCILLASVTLHEGLTSIGDNAFYYCRSLNALAIPASLTSISVSAFRCCSSLSSITVSAGNPKYDSRDDCNAIIETSTNTLLLGTASTIIPSSVTAIGTNAFYANTTLTSIVIPEGVRSIGTSAFSGCTSLVTAELPGTLTTIGYGAFNGCTKLSRVTLSEGLKTIDSDAFRQCSSLKKIHLPSTVTGIAYYAFYQCTSLVKVAVDFTTPITISSTTFSTRKNATLYVPAGCGNAFEEATYWMDFKRVVERQTVVDATADPKELLPGRSTTLSVSLTNDGFDDYCPFEMVLTLPEGFTLDASSLVLSDRCSGMEAAVESLENNAYHLTFSSASAVVTDTKGSLFTIDLIASSDVEAGNYHATISDIILVSDEGHSVSVPDVEVGFSVLSYPRGDVNHDGLVNMSDVTMTINYILGKEVESFHFESADCKPDGLINMSDVTTIINIILGLRFEI